MAGYSPQLITPPSGFGVYASHGARAAEWLDLADDDEPSENESDVPEGADKDDLDVYEPPPTES